MQNRARPLNKHAVATGPIVYWLDRDIRAHDNWALLEAQAIARKNHAPLLVVYNLVVNFLHGSVRQWDFKIRSLQELQTELAKKNIPLFVVLDETGTDSPRLLQKFCDKYHVGAVVTDFSPLRIQRAWKTKLAKSLRVSLREVDAHNIVPAWLASPKQEFGAYTLRPKLHRALPEYLTGIPSLKKHPVPFGHAVPTINWTKLLKHPAVNQDARATNFVPGEAAAHHALQHFLRHTLPRYLDRNNALADAQSNLSPYLHYGLLSAHRVALAVLKQAGVSLHQALAGETPVAAFLEELIVRRELADNFCLYNPDYDTPAGFPAWAQKTLHAHAHDPREYVYTRAEFEHARTHDDLWNAAQRELLLTGKMHGYLRMYWAKKIMEWTKTPADAMKIAIYLNDKYELDGRDPNGYTGIAWSIGGVHDRAWFERPIFGQIRYLARSGCAKKFDVAAYIAKYTR